MIVLNLIDHLKIPYFRSVYCFVISAVGQGDKVYAICA